MALLERMLTRQKLDADLFIHRMFLIDHPVTLTGYTSLIDLPQTMMLLQKQANHASSSERPLFALESGTGNCISIDDEQAVIDAMAEGYMILLVESSDFCIKMMPVARTLSRSIEAPTAENVLRGSISAFIEDLDTNIGILKKHVLSDNLRTQSYWIGKNQRRRAVLLYMEGQVPSSFLNSIIQQIESNLDKNIPNLLELSKLLGFPKWTLISRFNTTELPENVSSALRVGKVVLFLDRFPFALILPNQLMDMFAEENDRNFPLFFMIVIRFLRVVGVLANMLIPGLYVALVSVNPDVLRIEMALSIASSRAAVPYPSMIETLLLLVILELILEASIRLPKTIGPTITMVGGIILGQAVVQAKLVSHILIILLAATTISSFTVIGFHNAISIRISKYLLLILSAIYGVLGLFVGIVVVCAYLASLSSFGFPYVYRWKARGTSDG